MTMVAVWVALAGAALGAYNQNETAKKQDRQMAAQIRNQSAKQQSADAKIAAALTQQAGSNPQDEIAQQTNSYLETLRGGQQRGGFNTGPGAYSDAYRSDVDAAGLALDQYGVDRAGLLARIDAPGLQRQNEGIQFDMLANDIRGIGREAKGQDYLDSLRLGAIRNNPWIDALATGMKAYGSAGAGGGGGGAASSGSGATNVGNAFFSGGGLGGLGY